MRTEHQFINASLTLMCLFPNTIKYCKMGWLCFAGQLCLLSENDKTVCIPVNDLNSFFVHGTGLNETNMQISIYMSGRFDKYEKESWNYFFPIICLLSPLTNIHSSPYFNPETHGNTWIYIKTHHKMNLYQSRFYCYTQSDS